MQNLAHSRRLQCYGTHIILPIRNITIIVSLHKLGPIFGMYWGEGLRVPRSLKNIHTNPQPLRKGVKRDSKLQLKP